MKPWRRFAPSLLRGHAPCLRCQVCVQFTGKPPCNPSEDLIATLAGGRQSVPIHWLEGRVADALYDAALRGGAWAADIGVWGPDAFRDEAVCLLGDVRPEFGRLVEAATTGEQAS